MLKTVLHKRDVRPASVGQVVRRAAGVRKTIGAPNDPSENEAEHVADQVMQMPSAVDTPVLRQSDEEELVQSKSASPIMSVPQSAADAAAESVKAGGTVLPSSERAFFEPRFGRDFGNVRVHTDPAAADAARSINAHAFTLGDDIAFAGGEYGPGSADGRRLMAHELAHVVQQGKAPSRAGDPTQATDGATIRRDIAEDQLASTPVEDIMADDSYFERGIETIEFYSAELAILHYEDGSTIRLGLVPEFIEKPFVGVDYRTASAAHMVISPTATSRGTGSLTFIPHGAEMTFPPDVTLGDLPKVAGEIGRTVTFTHHASGKIVPTEVNTLTAPRLSLALREAEAEYIRRFDAMSEGNIEILEKLEIVMILASIYGALAEASAQAGARLVGTAARTAVGRAQSRLVRVFKRLLRSGGVEKSITVEGVQFGSIRVVQRGTELMVSRAAIRNVGRVPAQGRLIHGAFEQAARQAAREAGAKSARVALEMVQNPTWKAYLESRGYAYQLIAHETGWTNFLTKVFPL